LEFYQYIESAKGSMQITANSKGITAVSFIDTKLMPERPNEITLEASRQLTAYFDKKLQTFDLPLAPKGTAFQQSVWQVLQQISYGETASYLDIAKAINNPKGVRAVGMANGRNPIAIIVPCHRIIGSNKTLTGYAGGLERKQYLLNLEGAQGVLWQ